eukprot:5087789-Pyramimonas_sp.AAC.1
MFFCSVENPAVGGQARLERKRDLETSSSPRATSARSPPPRLLGEGPAAPRHARGVPTARHAPRAARARGRPNDQKR